MEDRKLLLISDVLMLKSPPFSKSFLNLVQFDGKFTGICKKRAVGLTTKKLVFRLYPAVYDLFG